MRIAIHHFKYATSIINKVAHIFASGSSAILVVLASAMFLYELFNFHKTNLVTIGFTASFFLIFSGVTFLIWNVGKFKIALKIMIVVIAVPISLFGILMGVYIGYGEYQDLTLPDICKNFDDSRPFGSSREAYVSTKFDDRIERMYASPIGEEDLKKSLVSLGFRLPEHPNPASLPHVWAYAEYNAFPCDSTWTVEWTTQGDGIAHDLHGRYNSSCL
jgi:hypothetical protein